MIKYYQNNSDRKKNYSPVKVGKIIEKIMTNYNDYKGEQKRLEILWEKVAGEKIVKHTKCTKINNKKIFIEVENSVWMNELTFLKGKLKIDAKKIFGEVGLIIEDIVFKLGQ